MILSFYCRSVGIPPPPDVAVVPYDDIASTLNTGDIILMSGVTTAGALIKSFDRAQFSHVAIVRSIDEYAIKLPISFQWFCSKNRF